MTVHDHLIRATVPGLRAFAAVTTGLAEEARRRHDCYPIAAAALGRTMTGGLLMAANLKAEESITLRIDGKGPLGQVIIDASPEGTVRGYVKNPHVELPLRNDKLDVGGAVGEGYIHVTRFTGLKQPFTGSAPLVSGEIAEDITNYLLVSEQTMSSVALGVLINPDFCVAAAGGFFIQALPGVEDDVLTKVEENILRLAPVSQLVKEYGCAKSILEKVFAGLSVRFYEEQELAFRCQCSKERIRNVLISLGATEIRELIKEGQAEMTCHFCGNIYNITKVELEDILQQINE